MSDNKARKLLKQELELLETVRSHYLNKMTLLEPSLNNSKYLKYILKLANIESKISTIKSQIKAINKRNRFYKKLFVRINSRVKLVSTEIGAVLWVDAKNLGELLGKRVGEIVQFQNSRYMIAGVY